MLRRATALKRICDRQRVQNACEQCGYIYEPAVGNLNIDIAPKITFEDIPEHWVCPIYGFGKDVFVPLEE